MIPVVAVLFGPRDAVAETGTTVPVARAVLRSHQTSGAFSITLTFVKYGLESGKKSLCIRSEISEERLQRVRQPDGSYCVRPTCFHLGG